jgi:hypothetical protein
VRVDEPDLLLGKPVAASEFAPNTLTTGPYFGIVGDFRRYWIAEGVLAEIQPRRAVRGRQRGRLHRPVQGRRAERAGSMGRRFRPESA